MPNYWIPALQEFNSGGKQWCIPRKGTKQYEYVVTIMERMKRGEEKKTNPKTQPKPKRTMNIEI